MGSPFPSTGGAQLSKKGKHLEGVIFSRHFTLSSEAPGDSLVQYKGESTSRCYHSFISVIMLIVYRVMGVSKPSQPVEKRLAEFLRKDEQKNLWSHLGGH
jgi:hypothetical protein